LNNDGDQPETGPPYHNSTWTDELEQHPRVRRSLAEGQARLELWMRFHAGTDILDWPMIVAFHRIMFESLFPDLAGRPRGPEAPHIPTDVEFGNYLGIPYGDVTRECQASFAGLPEFLRSVDILRDTATPALFREAALNVAAFTHCELIRIHPFVNGNGRVARACINYIARRYAMRAIPFDRPKGDYIDATRTYLQQRTHQHFMDFLRPAWRPSSD
jgi:fido (protein-threonine AMPylation protein)